MRAAGRFPRPAEPEHDDLHPWNVLDDGAGGVRYYDWGDGVVAHPFAAMLVPLGCVHRGLDAGLQHPAFLRASDAYLEVFSDLAPRAELVEALELACHVGKAARALTRERAVRVSRAPRRRPRTSTAPLESLPALLDDSYLGGA